ncbi:MAG: cation:proton antiporter subunit C [Desulfobacula sp.]|jgi:multicomponent Na+:H+ antiporter subunit C|nr:cation:proton antiporter subunit C [Desulfobacula sp.]MBT6340175.1 cation:proton antiporter subunit C [Desulfobacula sp.]
MDDVLTFIIYRLNYFVYIILMLLGMYGIFIKNNYMKKIIGLNILQTAIILFFISIGAKKDATIPILELHNGHGAHEAVQAVHYINPLPHVLMLTAIVVAVATLGVALAMAIKIYKDFGTIEEDKVLFQMTVDLDNKIIK